MAVTAIPDVNMGTGATGQIAVGSDKFKGRISFTTGTGITGQTLGRLDVGDSNNYDSDTIIVQLTQRTGPIITKEVQGEDSTGWEILSGTVLEESTTYEWNYNVTTIIQ